MDWLFDHAPNELLQVDEGATRGAGQAVRGLVLGFWGGAFSCAAHSLRTAALSVNTTGGRPAESMGGASAYSLRSLGLSVMGEAGDDVETAGVDVWTAPVRCLAALLRDTDVVVAAHAAAGLACLCTAFPSLLPAMLQLRCHEALKHHLDACSWTAQPRLYVWSAGGRGTAT